MAMNLYLISLVLLIIPAVLAVDRSFQSGNVKVKVMGRSGTMEIKFQNDAGNVISTLRVGLEKILEMDSDGDQVGKAGTAVERHGIESFTNVDFNVGTAKDEDVQGIAAKTISFNVKLTSGPTLKVKLVIFKEGGQVNYGHKYSVRRNDMRVHYEITDWEFCDKNDNPCANTDETGKIIDFFITVQGDKKAEAKIGGDGCFRRYRVGEARLCLPNKVRANNDWKTQKLEYPKRKDTINGKDRFVFCLNRPSGTYMANYLYDMSMSGSTKHVISAATVLALVFLRLLL